MSKAKFNGYSTTLIFEQGYGLLGNYYSDCNIGTFILDPSDKRKKVFAERLAVELKRGHPWIYRRVTHWMPLPKPPTKLSML